MRLWLCVQEFVVRVRVRVCACVYACVCVGGALSASKLLVLRLCHLVLHLLHPVPTPIRCPHVTLHRFPNDAMQVDMEPSTITPITVIPNEGIGAGFLYSINVSVLQGPLSTRVVVVVVGSQPR